MGKPLSEFNLTLFLLPAHQACGNSGPTNGKKLKDLLPIPKEVTKNVLISENLNLKDDNLESVTIVPLM